MSQYPAAQNIKRKEIQLIKIAQKQIGMDEESYRALLWTIGRVKSCRDLDWQGRKKLLDHFEVCGFKRTRPQPRALADDPQSKMIRSLWLQLHAAGKVRNPAESALAAFCKRQTGRDALQWLNGREASALIEELKKWLAR